MKNIQNQILGPAIGLFCLVTCLLCAGCTTAQTLSAQLHGEDPSSPGTGLPTVVARKLYGVCGYCNLQNPNCPMCLSVQKFNRKLAGANTAQRLGMGGVGSDYRAFKTHLERGGVPAPIPTDRSAPGFAEQAKYGTNPYSQRPTQHVPKEGPYSW